MKARLLAFVRSPLVRWAFLILTLALAVYAVAATWDQLVVAAGQLEAGTILAATAVSAAYIWCTLEAWRCILADLGSPLRRRAAVSLFGVSQLGKYLPGGVWNVIAAAEIGADHHIPRRRSVAAMALAVLVGVVSGAVVGMLTLPFLSQGALGSWSWLVWLAPLTVVVLLPPVLNPMLAWLLRITRQPALANPPSWRGLGSATAWSVLGWLLAGAQVWVLASGLGMQSTPQTVALAVGGYALAWVCGFLVVVSPAGAGAREVVLLAVLAGVLPHSAALLLALLSRVLLTVVDLALAGVGGAFARRRRPSPAP